MKDKIMKQYKIALIALLGIVLTSCYNKFEEPYSTVVYDDDIFRYFNPEAEYISIADLKAMFGEVSGTGDTDTKANTKYIRFVASESECNELELKNGWYNTGNYYLKGKVVSNDEEGNIYKSMYIFDGTGAIELKLNNGLYLDYPCDLDNKESMWVYVKVRGLYLGNFRSMLSLGDIPTSSYNSWGVAKYYPNSNILSPAKVKEHVLPGEKCRLIEGVRDTDDILVVDKNSYSDLFGEAGQKYLGRLIRFKDLTVRYAGANNQNGSTSPIGNNVYPQWFCSAGIPASLGAAPQYVVNKPWYKMAYSINGIAQYGSVLVTYTDSTPSKTNTAGVYTVRTSGYSRFANKFIPKDGAVGDVLAIYTLYSESWNSQYGTYQLSVCRYKDFAFETEPSVPYPAWSAHLTWAEQNFPQYMLANSADEATHAILVTAWEKQYESNKPANDNSPEWEKWNEWGEWVVWCLKNTPKESWLLPQYLTEEDDME